MSILYIAVGGAVGTLMRHGVYVFINRMFFGAFPLGTLTVNLLGSFIGGLLWGVFDKLHLSENMKLFMFLGVLGAFTTFSTYTIENVNLFRDGDIKIAIANIAISNFFGIALVFFGFGLARYLLKFL